MPILRPLMVDFFGPNFTVLVFFFYFNPFFVSRNSVRYANLND